MRIIPDQFEEFLNAAEPGISKQGNKMGGEWWTA